MMFIKFILLFLVGLSLGKLIDITKKHINTKPVLNKKDNTEKPNVTNLKILYDESKGHVVQATVDSRNQYLMIHRVGLSEAQEYLNEFKLDTQNYHKFTLPINEWRRMYAEQNNGYNHQLYLSLSNKPRKINQSIHKTIFEDKYNYTLHLSQASRYSDEELPKLECLIQEINRNQKYDKPLEELLQLNILNDTEEDRNYFFDQISLKLEQ